MLPGILTHLGSDGLSHLKRLASVAAESNRMASAAAADEDIPDLIDNFEQAMSAEDSTTAEVNIDEAIKSRNAPSETVD